ncbi:hypothetical protein [Rubripirellula tenax]|uniref:hypothetical protein n=1 Tax=Rubripirellula tenax TaxID=2528015 RepID=UPI0016468CE6|nr:hypothetical protein [Rubripirellula tenax]
MKNHRANGCAEPLEGTEDLAGNTEAAKPRQSGRMSRWLFAALIIAAACFAIRSLAPQTIGETVRRKFICQLQTHYPNHNISVRRGHFDPNIGLVLEDLRISEPTSMLSLRSREMVRIERITVMGDFQIEKLLDQQNPLVTRRVVVEGVTANVWLRENGDSSLAVLLPLPQLGPAAPRIDLSQIHLRLFGDDASSRWIDAELERALVVNRTRADGSTDHEITVTGVADFAKDIKLKITNVGGSVDVLCAATGVHFNRRLYDSLPSAWSDFLRNAKDLTCACDTSISYHKAATGKVDYRVQTNVHDGRFEHLALPLPLSQLRGVVVCDPSGITVDGGQANLGDAIVRIVNGRLDGHQWPSPATLTVKTRGLLLDERLAASLPPSLQEQWHKIQPLGRVDIDASLVHGVGGWDTNADLTCHGVDVRYEKFPYPIEQVVGRIELRSGIVSSDGLSGRVSSNRMLCAFRLPTKPGITNEKSFVVQTDGPIPIDNTLLQSLTPRLAEQSGLESFVRSLRPRGSVRLAMAVFATDAAGRQTRTIDLDVIDGHMRYEKFAYPLYNVSGKIRVENHLVKMSGFRATNANAGVILCDGTYQMEVAGAMPSGYRITDHGVVDRSESRLMLNFQAQNVPMDESLRSSLPYSTQQVWDAISPNGVLDELNVQLVKIGNDSPIGMDISARQLEHGQVTNRILSIRPPALPYRLDITGGVVRFDGSNVKIESLKASHDGSKISADGRCDPGEDGRWVLSTNLHSGSRLRPDAELIAALPVQMREAMRRLQLRGPVSIRGTTVLTIPDEARPEPVINWDLDLQLEGNRIADVGPVHSLRGEVSVQGTRNESVLLATGAVRIDSMHVDDLQLTNIQGPFSINNDRLDLGQRAFDRRAAGVGGETSASAPIRGKLFGGTIDLDGEVILSSGDFDVVMAVQAGRVPTLLADFGHGDNGLTGTFSGQTNLRGNLGTSDLLKGSGTARVSGANLYQLPMIVKVMNLISVTPTEDVAFTDGEIEFSLFGDTATFNKVHLWGDLVSLEGGGTLDRRQELDLTFNTRVSPQNTFTKIVRPLRSQRYTLMTIDVRGPVNDVRIERRALDGVGQTLERMFPGMGGNHEAEEQSDSPRSASQSRGWFK